MATCDRMLEVGVMSYPCQLPQGHEGPHTVHESPKLMAERKEWERRNREPEEVLSEPVVGTQSNWSTYSAERPPPDGTVRVPVNDHQELIYERPAPFPGDAVLPPRPPVEVAHSADPNLDRRIKEAAAVLRQRLSETDPIAFAVATQLCDLIEERFQ